MWWEFLRNVRAMAIAPIMSFAIRAAFVFLLYFAPPIPNAAAGNFAVEVFAIFPIHLPPLKGGREIPYA